MYASSCCSHPSLILERVITSSWSSRVTTASLPAPLTFFLPLSSFAAHFWLKIFSFNSIPNAFHRASHWTTDNPEMNASASFLSRSQKRVCESATFELAFSHSRRQVDAPFLPHARFLCSSICFPASASSSRTCFAFRLGSCSSVCDGKLLLLLDLTRTFSSTGETIDLSPVRGEEVAASRPMVWRKSWNWKPTIQNDRPVVFHISAVFLHTFLHAIGPSNRMTTQSLPPCEPRQ